MEKAEAFKGSVAPLLQSVWQALSDGRNQADTAARQLAGEAGEDMSMGGLGGDEMAGMAAGEVPGGMPPGDAGMGDDFGATDAAAGGEAELGRERRGVEEAKKAKPDFLDVDGDGNKKETFKKAVKDKAKK